MFTGSLTMFRFESVPLVVLVRALGVEHDDLDPALAQEAEGVHVLEERRDEEHDVRVELIAGFEHPGRGELGDCQRVLDRLLGVRPAALVADFLG
jgi:hypothetical protein